MRHFLAEPLKVALKVARFANPAIVAIRLYRPRLRIRFRPGQPSHHQVLYKICALNGYRIVHSDDFDLGVQFIKGGIGKPFDFPMDRPVLNRGCHDVSKRIVANVFAKAFGYSLDVDPTTYTGEIVEKSDANYAHDGRIISGPISADQIRPGYVYQRLIQSIEDNDAIDLRTPIYGGTFPLVYVKRRPLSSRFSNQNSSVEVRSAAEIFSPRELSRLALFAELMGIDYGEADVLRDADGRIYVVDVTGNPAGPPNGLGKKDAKRAVAILSEAFRKALVP